MSRTSGSAEPAAGRSAERPCGRTDGPTAIRVAFAGTAPAPSDEAGREFPEWQQAGTREALAARVGANVRRLRRRRGLSQRQLGKAIGRDRSTISRYEAGERLPHLPALLALAGALRCSQAELLKGIEDRGPSR